MSNGHEIGTATGTKPATGNRSTPFPVPERPSKVRFGILGLTFFLFFIMYMDRACMGLVAPNMMREFRISKITLGWSVSAFVWAYGIFQIPGGWLADRFGPRRVLSGVLLWWSCFAVATGL